MAEGEVERGALERPTAIEAGAVADRLDRKEVGQPQQRGEFLQGAPPAQPREVARSAQLLDLIDLIPGDVLALSLMAIPGQPDHDRDLGESARGIACQRQQLAAFDLKRQLGDARVGLIGAAPSRRAFARRDSYFGTKGHRSSVSHC